MPDEIEVVDEDNLEAAFNEFADEGNENTEQPRDEAGRFVTEEPEEEVPVEEPETVAEETETVSEQPSETPEESSESEPETDWEAQLEKSRNETQEWQHRYNSDLGRQNALQRKIADQEQEIADLKAASQAPQNPGVSDSVWEEFQKDFPDIAAAVDAKVGSMVQAYEGKISELQGQIQPIQRQAQDMEDRAHQSFVESQKNILEQQHPGWVDTVNTEEFVTWLKAQPVPVRQLGASDNAADAAYLLDAYKLATAPTPEPEPEPEKDNLREVRQEQLRDSQTIPSRTGRKTNVAEDDLETAFNYYAEQ